MRISYNWLRRWVPAELTAGEVADRFTAAGLEVDRLTAVGEGLEGVVVAEITECREHPDADRLRVCTVDAGDGEALQIVCGAPNARAGLKAPLARVGSVLPGGLKIKPARLRGVESRGMLCSEPELGLGEDTGGLMELAAESVPGTPLAETLNLPDWILEFDLTPNRADCLSVRGLARELAALTETPIRVPDIAAVEAVSDTDIAIELAAPADCPRYVGRVIEDIDPCAPTPAWMREALRGAGLRSLGPVVDVTNYVLLELGQPMHAFDLDALDGGIRVRRAASGDRIRLLDDREITPDEDMLLICDQSRPVALAGVMGGADSAVGDGTRRILLESAWFSPAVITGRARRLGLATESAHRFERGVDPGLQTLAVERATALLLEIAGGRPGPVCEALEADHLPETPEVPLRLDRLNRLLGTALTGTEVRSVLTRLDMRVHGTNQEFRIRPPSARRDIAIEADLIEEVARMVGYDQLPVRAPGGRLEAAVESETRVSVDALGAALQARGFQEIITWSFVAEDELRRLGLEIGAQPLANPLSRDMGVLRTGLLSGLLATAAANRRRQRGRARLYETGHVFLNHDSGFVERERLGLLMYGTPRPEGWSDPRRAPDFFDLKGEVEHLLALGGRRDGARFQPSERAWLHPGQAADLILDGEAAGWIGQVHPEIAARLDFEGPVLAAEIDLEPVRRRCLPVHAGIRRYPSVRRDLALILPEAVSAGEVLQTVRDTIGELLEDCVIFDRYQGKGIEEDCKSLAIGLILRDVSRTLTDEEVDRLVDRTISELASHHNARLRG